MIIRGKIKHDLLKQRFINKTNKSIFPLLNIKDYRRGKNKFRTGLLIKKERSKMFCGKYLARVQNKKIKLKQGFNGCNVDILCAKKENDVLITVLTADENELKEYMEVYEVVDHIQTEIDDVVVLPDAFYNSLGNDKIVTIFGVQKSIEIVKNDSVEHLFE